MFPLRPNAHGDFSGVAAGKPIRDPLANAPYPGNIIPASQFSPISKYIIDNALASANFRQQSVRALFRILYDDHQVTARGDHSFSDQNRISGRYFKSWASSPAFLDQKNVLAQTSGGQWYNESVSVTDTHIFSANLVNQALFSFNHTDGAFVPIQPTKSLLDLGAKYSNAAIYKWQIAVSGYFSIDTADTNNFPRRERQFVDTLRWTHGKHQITFGGDYSRGYNDAINNFRANGQWAFGGTSLFTNDGLADFIIGRFNTLTQGVGEYKNTSETHLGDVLPGFDQAHPAFHDRRGSTLGALLPIHR